MPDRRPLVLTVYDLDAFPHLVAKARGAARAKRLTDAELAAEWHDWVAHMKHLQWSELSSEEPLTDEQWAPVHARAMTLWRFATHPHYDERRTDA